MIDESPPGRGNRGGFRSSVSGTSCNQASGVATEIPSNYFHRMIALWSISDESPPGRGKRGGFSSGVSGTLGIQVS